MTPHLFKSGVHRDLWVCCAKQLTSDPRRRYEPVPEALVVYGVNPRHAYERWVEYSKLRETRGPPRYKGIAWVSEYSGNDSTWRVCRSALVTVKRKVNHVGSA